LVLPPRFPEGFPVSTPVLGRTSIRKYSSSNPVYVVLKITVSNEILLGQIQIVDVPQVLKVPEA
jgi:hypothetical protein